MELHHAGGRNHVAWFVVPLCVADHRRLTAALRQAGVDMSYTPDPSERRRRARQACLIFLWMLDEQEKCR